MIDDNELMALIMQKTRMMPGWRKEHSTAPRWSRTCRIKTARINHINNRLQKASA